jgi:hypothetical protein
MLKYLILLTIVFMSLQFQTIREQKTIKGEQQPKLNKKELHIYLLIGQSNMAGRAEIMGSDADTLENVFLYTGNPEKQWEKAANPLNKCSSIRKDLSMQKLGPGYHFAKNMLEFDKENSIGLVVNAKGGTSISEWKPGSHFYNEAVKRTKDALESGNLKGILWHQGESDVSALDTYTSQIVNLMEAFREDFNSPDLPVVVGQLSEDKPQRIQFNKMILQLPFYIENVGVVTSENTITFDSTHFNRQSQRLLGERYAREMQKLLNLLNK